MTKQAVIVELFYDGVWNNITSNDEVFTETPITITRGQSSESQSPRPCSITCQLNNATDKYRVSNPQSPLYGKVGRNTPIRISVGDVVRGNAEIASWETDQSRDFKLEPRRGKAWTNITAGGLLRRINQSSTPVESAMQRYLTRRTDLVDYWPGYDPDSSTQVTPLGDGNPARAEDGFKLDTTFGKADAPLGSTASFQIGTESAIVANARPGTGSWTMGFAFRLTKPVPAGPAQPIFMVEMNDLWSATVYVDDTSYNLVVENPTSSGTDLLADYDQGDDPLQWVLMTISFGNVSGSTGVMWSWYPQSGSSREFTDTFSSAPLPVIDWRINSNDNIVDAEFSEIFMLNSDEFSVADAQVQEAFDAYDGELVSYRFARLMDEQLGSGYYYVSTSIDATSVMGPQVPDTFPNLIQDCVTTEDAVLVDHIGELRLYFLSRFDRYNQAPLVDLSPFDFPVLPKETVDDLNIANVVTVNNRNGANATATDATTVLGTQTPPDGVGEYKRTLDINIHDVDTLPQYANWYMRRGTVNLPRFPQVTLDLVATPALIDEVNILEVGSVLTITSFRENPLRLQILGWTEIIGNNTRKITFNCTPDQQFDVGVYGSASVTTNTRRYDSRTTVLKTAVNKTDTTLVFRTTNQFATWSTTATPYDVMIEGERLTVTSMGAAALVSGAYDQSATVVRAVNGIFKALSANDPIHITPQGRYAL